MKIRGFYWLCAAVIFTAGCVSTKNATEPDMIIPEQKVEKVVGSEEPAELKSAIEQAPEENAQLKGVIFAKTDFQGLLEARYVKLFFEDLDDAGHKFQINIGESSGQQTFPWDVKTVKPGYFLVEIPVGRYVISSVTIPVGTATATETMNVTMEVLPNTVTYVGTLKMVGTKEKFKLGGVPVIKPGFEYTVEILDERDEGAAVFRNNYPDYPHGVSVQLMEAHKRAGDQDESSPKE